MGSKYTHEYRQKLRKRIRAMKRQRATRKAMVRILNEEGFKTPSGGEITPQFLSNQIINMGKSKKSKLPKVSVKRKLSKTAQESNTDKGLEQITRTLLTATMDPKSTVAALKAIYKV